MTVEYTDEILTKIDKAEGDEKIALLKKYGSVSPLNAILSLNFRESMNLGIPEGMPPLSIYKRDEETHPDLMPSILAVQIRRIIAIFQQKEALGKSKREAIFLQVLEAIPYKEADVLIFAKDHALTELYPTITYELVESVFPNYCQKSAQ